MKRLLSFVLLPAIIGLACARSNGATSPTHVVVTSTPANQSITITPLPATFVSPAAPEQYQSTYTELDTALASFINSLPTSKGEPLNLGAELSYANGNIGEPLLNPSTIGLVQKQLDVLKSMGVREVVVAIKFPLLEPDFPHSADYLQFFKQVSAEIHARGMKLLVEAGPIFSGTIYSSVHVDWSQYNKDTFVADQQNELITIANQVQPDYLQIANEPSTITKLTGIQFTPADYASFIQSSVQKIGHPNGVKLGAGAGTWDDPAYMNDLMDIQGLDCIDIHIYPLGRDASLLQRAYTTALDARNNGKCAVISEAWLYKVSAEDLTAPGSTLEAISSQDSFSFWEPLDEEFIRAVTRLSQASGIEFVSFFWTRMFFTDLDYSQYGSLSFEQLNGQLNQTSLVAMQNGTLSPLGLFFQNWIADGFK